LLAGCSLSGRDLSMHFPSEIFDSRTPWYASYRYTQATPDDERQLRETGIIGTFVWLGPRCCRCVQVRRVRV